MILVPAKKKQGKDYLTSPSPTNVNIGSAFKIFFRLCGNIDFPAKYFG